MTDGKIFVITGATSGIGYEAASKIANLGGIVIGIGSSAKSCRDAELKLNRLSLPGDIRLLACDLSDQDDVRALGRLLAKEYPVIDVLVNNAGTFLVRRTLSKQGIEKTFAVNYLSHYLLTRLLIGNLKKASPSRVLNVSSVAYKGANIDTADLSLNDSYTGWKAYSRTKLAMILFTRFLDKKLKDTDITVNSLHPGVIGTNLFSKNSWVGPFLNAGLKLVGKSPEKGAETLVYLATSEEVNGCSGGYYVNSRLEDLLDNARGESLAQDLWDVSADLCNIPTDLSP